MPQDDSEDIHEPRRLLLLLGAGTALVVALIVIFWPRDDAPGREAARGKLFNATVAAAPAPAPRRASGAKPPLPGGLSYRGFMVSLERASERPETAGAAKGLAAAFDGDPALRRIKEEFERKDKAGEAATAKEFAERLREQPAFAAYLQGAAQDPAQADGLKELGAAQEFNGLLGSPLGALAGGPGGAVAAGAPGGAAARGGSGAGAGARGGTGAGGGPGATEGTGAKAGKGARQFRNLAGAMVGDDPDGDSGGGFPKGGAPESAAGGEKPKAERREPKVQALLDKFPFVAEIFNPAQLSTFADDVDKHGVWGACVLRKEFAHCKSACDSGRPPADGQAPRCATGGGWTECMSAFQDEARCIRLCKGQAGCVVNHAVWNRHCAQSGFSIPPSYCWGL